MDASAQSVHGVGDATEKTAKKSTTLRKTLGNLATGFAVYKGAQYIKRAVKNTTDLAKATAGLQRITGMDTRSAAGGTRSRAAWRAIRAARHGVYQLGAEHHSAASGSKASREAFSKLGLDAAGLKAQEPRRRNGDARRLLRRAPRRRGQGRAGAELFGRQAQTMLPLLNQARTASTSRSMR